MPAQRPRNPDAVRSVRLSRRGRARDAGASGVEARCESARSLGLFHAAQALAAIQGNDSVSIAHVKTVAEVVLAHRLLVRLEARKDYPDGGAVIKEILAKVNPASQ